MRKYTIDDLSELEAIIDKEVDDYDYAWMLDEMFYSKRNNPGWFGVGYKLLLYHEEAFKMVKKAFRDQMIEEAEYNLKLKGFWMHVMVSGIFTDKDFSITYTNFLRLV